MIPKEKIKLNGMLHAVPRTLPGWETAWTLFGPVSDKEDETPWPGKIGFNPLPLDAVTGIPAKIEILGQIFSARQADSHQGLLDFGKIFKLTGDRAIVYMMTLIRSSSEAVLPISFGANRATQWWMNGKPVYESMKDWRDPDDWASHQLEAPITKGDNLLAIRLIGSSTGCSIRISKLHPRPQVKSKPVAILEKPSTALKSGKTKGRTLLPTRDYCEAGLRVEERPNPLVDRKTRLMREKVMAAHEVKARWIGIVDDDGSPYARSKFLLRRKGATLEDERKLKLQVQAIHDAGMVAISWIPGSHCLSGALSHPDWLTVSLKPDNDSEMVRRNVCINSPFGDALIGFLIESLDFFDLDGFWIDGTIWTHPGNVGCLCKHCRKLFKAEEGLDLPDKVDWGGNSFRRWVAWRYRSYMGYWGRLAAEVRRSCPRARIMINMTHRFPYWMSPGAGLIESWLSAIPIDCCNADIIPSLETIPSPPLISAFHSRLGRAYGKEQTESWMGLHSLYHVHETRPPQMDSLNPMLHHAMASMTAGAMPSYGTPHPGEKPRLAYAELAELINPLRQYVGGKSEPYAALHLSQQAETFFFSRRSDNGFPRSYWQSVLGWHNLLCENQFLTDLVFDGRLTQEQISRWPLVIAPLSIALSDSQVRVFEKYVESGGVLFSGPYFGACNEWGEKADPRRMKKLLGCHAETPPDPEETSRQDESVRISRIGSGICITAGDIGNRFYSNRSAVLASEVGGLIRRCAPPRVSVKGPRRLHVGMYRANGRLRLFIHNFVAYSEYLSFPNPRFLVPKPVEDVKVSLRGYNISSARIVFPSGSGQLETRQRGDMLEFTVPRIERGTVIEMDI